MREAEKSAAIAKVRFEENSSRLNAALEIRLVISEMYTRQGRQNILGTVFSEPM